MPLAVLSLDRLPANDLVMTQELIANMLGVRREGVTAAASKLQATGLIEYFRGKITVLDRTKLEERVCECYAVVKKEYDRLLPAGVRESVAQRSGYGAAATSCRLLPSSLSARPGGSFR